jgi:predicted nucleotidyltransferase
MPGSDIDLVAYGIKPARKLYSILNMEFDSFTCIERYSGEALNQHVNFRWGEHNERWDLLKSIEAKKNLQGLFEGNEFFIRLVKKQDETRYKYGDLIFQKEGLVSVYCEVLDDSDSIFTPCTYIVNCGTKPDLIELTSYRGRFTEQVTTGMNVKASGRLESVRIQKTGETYQRLVLGENPADYLVPI